MGFFFTDCIPLISTLVALITVYYAWNASRESRVATEAAQETAKIAAAASMEYVRWRHQDHLRAIAQYVADIKNRAREIESIALAQAESGRTDWRCASQESLAISIKGMLIPLPRCHALADPLGLTLLSATIHERKGLVAREWQQKLLRR